MKWSWNLGRIAGIDVKIHLTFLILLVWVAFAAMLSGGSFSAVIGDVFFILALFLCVVLHELGHALAARRFGIPTRDITLLPIGGVARLETMPEDPKEEFIVAAAGPAVNVLIGAVLFASLLISGTLAQPLTPTLIMNNFWLRLLSVNISLVLFNLIPAFPMDGGRVLRSILASRMDYIKATRTAANIGRGFAIVMGIAGFFVNPLLILTAVFIWSGAGAEAKSVEIKRGLKGLRVRDALISQFYTADANQPLASVFQLAMQTGQHDIPVVSNGHYLGIIRRQDLLNALDKMGDRAPAYAAIGVELEGLDPEVPLQDVLPKFATSRVLPVVENHQLIGLITPESIEQQIWLNQRVKSADASPPGETAHPA